VYTPSTREAELLVFEHLVLAEEDGLAVYRNQTSRVDLWPWPCLESLMHVKKVKSYDGIVAHYSGQKPSDDKNPVTDGT
jgi:predicted amino acid dehydrogenase